MAVTQLNSTTLTPVITPFDNEFTVGSTANIVVGNLIVIRKEAMKVQDIPVSGRVKVMRGVNGTRAVTHPAASRIYIGAPDAFKAIAESFTAITGDAGPMPDYMLPGQKATDGAGNEYILVDLQATVYKGVTVLIDSAHDGTFFAAVLTAGAQGIVGVMAEEGSSNQYAWAQIYGNCTAQDAGGTSAGDSTYLAGAATSVSSPAAGMAISVGTSGAANAFLIKGMFVTGVATTATTSATSHTGVEVPVFLNYPYVNSVQDTINS